MLFRGQVERIHEYIDPVLIHLFVQHVLEIIKIVFQPRAEHGALVLADRMIVGAVPDAELFGGDEVIVLIADEHDFSRGINVGSGIEFPSDFSHSGDIAHDQRVFEPARGHVVKPYAAADTQLPSEIPEQRPLEFFVVPVTRHPEVVQQGIDRRSPGTEIRLDHRHFAVNARRIGNPGEEVAAAGVAFALITRLGTHQVEVGGRENRRRLGEVRIDHHRAAASPPHDGDHRFARRFLGGAAHQVGEFAHAFVEEPGQVDLRHLGGGIEEIAGVTLFGDRRLGRVKGNGGIVPGGAEFLRGSVPGLQPAAELRQGSRRIAVFQHAAAQDLIIELSVFVAGQEKSADRFEIRLFFHVFHRRTDKCLHLLAVDLRPVVGKPFPAVAADGGFAFAVNGGFAGKFIGPVGIRRTVDQDDEIAVGIAPDIAPDDPVQLLEVVIVVTAPDVLVAAHRNHLQVYARLAEVLQLGTGRVGEVAEIDEGRGEFAVDEQARILRLLQLHRGCRAFFQYLQRIFHACFRIVLVDIPVPVVFLVPGIFFPGAQPEIEIAPIHLARRTVLGNDHVHGPDACRGRIGYAQANPVAGLPVVKFAPLKRAEQLGLRQFFQVRFDFP